ncbi:hypothetical protein SDC9_158143 [bioreactor metagenome]|uniref:Uncharacterized protein n=1 Tax=bioreactor metagenome TaxID=1076179 RepID=A0A645FB57_9ZZZZ
MLDELADADGIGLVARRSVCAAGRVCAAASARGEGSHYRGRRKNRKCTFDFIHFNSSKLHNAILYRFVLLK